MKEPDVSSTKTFRRSRRSPIEPSVFATIRNVSLHQTLARLSQHPTKKTVSLVHNQTAVFTNEHNQTGTSVCNQPVDAVV